MFIVVVGKSCEETIAKQSLCLKLFIPPCLNWWTRAFTSRNTHLVIFKTCRQQRQCVQKQKHPYSCVLYASRTMTYADVIICVAE